MKPSIFLSHFVSTRHFLSLLSDVSGRVSRVGSGGSGKRQRETEQEAGNDNGLLASALKVQRHSKEVSP